MRRAGSGLDVDARGRDSVAVVGRRPDDRWRE